VPELHEWHAITSRQPPATIRLGTVDIPATIVAAAPHPTRHDAWQLNVQLHIEPQRIIAADDTWLTDRRLTEPGATIVLYRNPRSSTDTATPPPTTDATSPTLTPPQTLPRVGETPNP
jgi:hypothetical protein